MSVNELIERLQNASGPNRLLDSLINREVGGDDPCPHYTGSIDAALTLVPDRTIWEFRRGSWNILSQESGMTISCHGGRLAGDDHAIFDLASCSHPNSPAIAACVASLTARRALAYAKKFNINDKVRVLPHILDDMRGPDKKFYSSRSGTIQKLYMASALVVWPVRSRNGDVTHTWALADLERVDAAAANEPGRKGDGMRP